MKNRREHLYALYESGKDTNYRSRMTEWEARRTNETIGSDRQWRRVSGRVSTHSEPKTKKENTA